MPNLLILLLRNTYLSANSTIVPNKSYLNIDICVLTR